VVAFFVGGIAMLCFPPGGIALFAVCWGLANFCMAHVWGATSRVAAGWIDEEYQGRVFGMVFGVAADGSQILAALVVGAILDSSGAAWRLPFDLTGVAMLLVVVLLVFTLRDSAAAAGFRAPRACSAGASSAAHPLDSAGLVEAMLAFGASARCWSAARRPHNCRAQCRRPPLLPSRQAGGARRLRLLDRVHDGRHLRAPGAPRDAPPRRPAAPPPRRPAAPPPRRRSRHVARSMLSSACTCARATRRACSPSPPSARSPAPWAEASCATCCAAARFSLSPS